MSGPGTDRPRQEAAHAAKDDASHAAKDDASHAAKSGAVQVLTIAGQALLTVTNVLLARLFGRSVFGAYQASLAIVEMLTRGGTGGADKGMLRFVPGARARGEPAMVRAALGTGLRLGLVVGGLGALALVALAPLIARASHDPTMTTGLRLMAPAIVLTGGVWILAQASLAARVTRPNFIVRGLGEPVLLLVAGLTAAAVGRSLHHLAVAHVAAAGATFLLALFVVGPVFGKGAIAQSLRAPSVPGFVRFSLPLGLSELVNVVLQRADIVILTLFLGAGATGVYAAAEFITRVISNTRYVFDSIAAAVFSEALHLGQRERLQQSLSRMTRWVLTVATPIAVTVIVLRHELLSLYGPAFQGGAPALVILALGHLVNASLGLAGWILVTSGRSRLLLMNNLGAATLNIVAGLTLIPRYGLVGTAIASLGSVAAMQIAGVVEVALTERVLAFDRSSLKPLVSGAVTLAAEVAIARLCGGSTAVRVLLVIVAGLGIYGGSLLALGLAPEDRTLLQRARARLGRWFGRAQPSGGSSSP